MHFFFNVLLSMCQFNTKVVLRFYYIIIPAACILLNTLTNEASSYIHALTSPPLLFNLYRDIFSSQVIWKLLCSVSSKQSANKSSLGIHNQILILCKKHNVSKARQLNCNLIMWYEICLIILCIFAVFVFFLLFYQVSCILFSSWKTKKPTINRAFYIIKIKKTSLFTYYFLNYAFQQFS